MPAKASVQKKTSRKRRTGAARPYDVRVLFIEDGQGWSAQVLEYDIATQADTLEDLFYEVERILVAHIALAAEEGRAPFEGLRPAPAKYWEVFKKSQFVMRGPAMGIRPTKFHLPRINKDIRIANKAAA